jgi:hypothetical protein
MFMIAMNNTDMRVNPELLQIIVQRKPMLRLLAALSKNYGIPTRQLLEGEFNGMDLHREIIEAERLGYVKRVKVEKPKGEKGNHLMVNLLTPKGKRIVKTAKELGLV